MNSRSGAKLGSLSAVLFGLGAAFACTVEDNLPIGDWIDAQGGAGGSGGSGGSVSGGSGGSVTAGTGAGPSAGSGGSLSVNCDYAAVLPKTCARAGCHNSRQAVSGLDLTPNEGLVALLKDQPAAHREIDCGEGGPYRECVPATCPPPGAALLVDSANPDASWILRKINGTQDDCGEQMPIAPGDAEFDAEAKACITELVYAIAASGNGGSGPGSDCFSPTNPPDPSGSGQVGCECGDDEDLCVVVDDAGRRHELTLSCRGSRWMSIEDGVCQRDLGRSACQVSGPEVTQIVGQGAMVPSPLSTCNTCTCGDQGQLVDCTGNLCADRECPSGTAPGERCIQCGSPGGCGILETGCLAVCESGEDCGGSTPNCIDGFCQAGPCI